MSKSKIDRKVSVSEVIEILQAERHYWSEHDGVISIGAVGALSNVIVAISYGIDAKKYAARIRQRDQLAKETEVANG